MPHERIFFMGEVADVHRHHAQFLAWAHYHVLVRLAVKAEVFVGMIKLAGQYAGTSHLPHVNTALARAITYATILRGMMRYRRKHADVHPVRLCRAQSGDDGGGAALRHGPI